MAVICKIKKKNNINKTTNGGELNNASSSSFNSRVVSWVDESCLPRDNELLDGMANAMAAHEEYESVIWF
jgi:hypothetical protein